MDSKQIGSSNPGRAIGPQYADGRTVSDAEWKSAVQDALAKVTADDVLDELSDCTEFIDAAVKADRPDLIGAIYIAVRRAYAERLAWREVYGTRPDSLPTAKEVALELLLALLKARQ